MSGAASWCLIAIVLLFAFVTVALLAALAMAVIKINHKLEKLTNTLEPIAVKASDTLESVQRVTSSVGEKADQILTRGVALTENVSTNVERTASAVQKTVTTPLIKLSSVIAGVSKSVSVYATSGRSNGTSTGTKDPKE